MALQPSEAAVLHSVAQDIRDEAERINALIRRFPSRQPVTSGWKEVRAILGWTAAVAGVAVLGFVVGIGSGPRPWSIDKSCAQEMEAFYAHTAQ